MDSHRAAKTGLISLVLALFMVSSVHATIIGIPAFSPSYECNTLFGAQTGTTIPSGNAAVTGASSSSFQSLMNTYGLSYNIPGGAIALSILALMISFLVIAVAYALGKLIPSSNINNWLQKEYWEVIKTAVLIAIVFLSISFISSMGLILNGSSSAIQGYPTSVQSLALYSENYLCTVNNQANLSIDNFAPYIFDVSFVKSISLSFSGIPIPNPALDTLLPALAALPVFRSGVSGVYLYQSFLLGVNIIYLGQFSSLLTDFVIYLVVPAMVFYSSQIVILPFLIFLGLAVLFPIGIVMRSLPLFRGIGGTLIAFAIGIAIIWPSILILFNAPISNWFCSVVGTNFCTPLGPVSFSPVIQASNSALSFCQDPANLPQGFLSSACSSIVTTVTTVFNNPTGNSVATSVQGVTSIMGYLPMAFSSGSNIFPLLNMLVEYNLYLILQFYVLGVIDLMILYSLTDNIAKMLGGSIRLSLGRKLKLV